MAVALIGEGTFTIASRLFFCKGWHPASIVVSLVGQMTNTILVMRLDYGFPGEGLVPGISPRSTYTRTRVPVTTEYGQTKTPPKACGDMVLYLAERDCYREPGMATLHGMIIFPDLLQSNVSSGTDCTTEALNVDIQELERRTVETVSR